jgi:choline dehydrogenase-like flavoprotein
VFEPYYTRAEKLFCVHGKSGIDPTEPPRSQEYPFPPVSNEPRMQAIQDSVAGLGYKPYPVPLGLKLNEADRLRSACIRCDTCDGFPCLVHAKADSDIDCIRPVMDRPNVTLRTSAKVTNILTNATGTAVTGVEVELNDPQNGAISSATFTGDIVVISCGAINSAALLLKCASDRYPNGLANSSDIVGRHFISKKTSTSKVSVIRMAPAGSGTIQPDLSSISIVALMTSTTSMSSTVPSSRRAGL